MRAGTLRHRLTFQTRSSAQTASLDQVETYTDSFTVWGSVSPLSGKETVASDAIRNEGTHQVRIRYREGVLGSMRIRFGSRYFNILSLPRNLDERGRELVMEVKEGVSLG